MSHPHSPPILPPDPPERLAMERADHIPPDGIDAARFIQAVRELLETPALLFADAG